MIRPHLRLHLLPKYAEVGRGSVDLHFSLVLVPVVNETDTHLDIKLDELKRLHRHWKKVLHVELSAGGPLGGLRTLPLHEIPEGSGVDGDWYEHLLHGTFEAAKEDRPRLPERPPDQEPIGNYVASLQEDLRKATAERTKGRIRRARFSVVRGEAPQAGHDVASTARYPRDRQADWLIDRTRHGLGVLDDWVRPSPAHLRNSPWAPLAGGSTGAQRRARAVAALEDARPRAEALAREIYEVPFETLTPGVQLGVYSQAVRDRIVRTWPDDPSMGPVASEVARRMSRHVLAAGLTVWDRVRTALAPGRARTKNIEWSGKTTLRQRVSFLLRHPTLLSACGLLLTDVVVRDDGRTGFRDSADPEGLRRWWEEGSRLPGAEPGDRRRAPVYVRPVRAETPSSEDQVAAGGGPGQPVEVLVDNDIRSVDNWCCPRTRVEIDGAAVARLLGARKRGTLAFTIAGDEPQPATGTPPPAPGDPVVPKPACPSASPTFRVVRGTLDFRGRCIEDDPESTPLYGLSSVDIDQAASRLVAASRAEGDLHEDHPEPVPKTPGTDDEPPEYPPVLVLAPQPDAKMVPVPAFRSDGVSLMAWDRLEVIKAQWARAITLTHGASAERHALEGCGLCNADLTLSDLTLGVRPELYRARRDGKTPFVSLCQRKVLPWALDARGKDKALPRRGDFSKEELRSRDFGAVEFGVHLVTPGPDDPVQKRTWMTVAPTLFTWDGWPMTTPRPPGRTSKRVGGTKDESGHLYVETQPLPGENPVLSFGDEVRMRVPFVDLSGWTPPGWWKGQDSAEDEVLMMEEVSHAGIRFLRYEPVSPPTVVTAFQGSVKSSKAENLLPEGATATDIVFCHGAHPDLAARALVPPRASLLLLEHHGLMAQLAAARSGDKLMTLLSKTGEIQSIRALAARTTVDLAPQEPFIRDGWRPVTGALESPDADPAILDLRGVLPELKSVADLATALRRILDDETQPLYPHVRRAPPDGKDALRIVLAASREGLDGNRLQLRLDWEKGTRVRRTVHRFAGAEAARIDVAPPPPEAEGAPEGETLQTAGELVVSLAGGPPDVEYLVDPLFGGVFFSATEMLPPGEGPPLAASFALPIPGKPWNAKAGAVRVEWPQAADWRAPRNGGVAALQAAFVFEGKERTARLSLPPAAVVELEIRCVPPDPFELLQHTAEWHEAWIAGGGPKLTAAETKALVASEGRRLREEASTLYPESRLRVVHATPKPLAEPVLSLAALHQMFRPRMGPVWCFATESAPEPCLFLPREGGSVTVSLPDPKALTHAASTCAVRLGVGVDSGAVEPVEAGVLLGTWSVDRHGLTYAAESATVDELAKAARDRELILSKLRLPPDNVPGARAVAPDATFDPLGFSVTALTDVPPLALPTTHAVRLSFVLEGLSRFSHHFPEAAAASWSGRTTAWVVSSTRPAPPDIVSVEPRFWWTSRVTTETVTDGDLTFPVTREEIGRRFGFRFHVRRAPGTMTGPDERLALVFDAPGCPYEQAEATRWAADGQRAEKRPEPPEPRDFRAPNWRDHATTVADDRCEVYDADDQDRPAPGEPRRRFAMAPFTRSKDDPDLYYSDFMLPRGFPEGGFWEPALATVNPYAVVGQEASEMVRLPSTALLAHREAVAERRYVPEGSPNAEYRLTFTPSAGGDGALFVHKVYAWAASAQNGDFDASVPEPRPELSGTWQALTGDVLRLLECRVVGATEQPWFACDFRMEV